MNLLRTTNESECMMQPQEILIFGLESQVSIESREDPSYEHETYPVSFRPMPTERDAGNEGGI